MTVADLSLIPVLVTAYAVVLGGAALATGWQLFRDRDRPAPARWRRGTVVAPPLAGIGVGDTGRNAGIGGGSE